MPGKRLARAVHGPEEDRAHRLVDDRSKGRMRTKDRFETGLSAKDEARLKAWQTR
jgi:hypothetical protein